LNVATKDVKRPIKLPFFTSSKLSVNEDARRSWKRKPGRQQRLLWLDHARAEQNVAVVVVAVGAAFVDLKENVKLTQSRKKTVNKIPKH
jgi:hypothetical protein